MTVAEGKAAERLKEAIEKAINASPSRRFVESLELVVVLPDLEIKKGETKLREVFFLPHPPRKTVRICLVAEGDLAYQAKQTGLFFRVLGRADLDDLSRSKRRVKKLARECDWVLVQTDLMGFAGRVLGPALGPRGKTLVPVPPRSDPRQLAERYAKAVLVRVKDQPHVQVRIGTIGNTIDELIENAAAVIGLVESKLKGTTRIGPAYVKKTMGKPVKIAL